MTPQFEAKPEVVQLTEWGAGRVPQGDTWMAFEVDSVAPSCTHPMFETIVMVLTPQDCWAVITMYGRSLRATTKRFEARVLPFPEHPIQNRTGYF